MDNTGKNISARNKQYCEMTATYWVWKNTHHTWKGIEHYRRHLLVKPEMLAEKFKSTSINRDYILSTINFYDSVREELVSDYLQGNKFAFRLISMLHEDVCPLFYAWEYFGYGRMNELWKEDLAIETYNNFKSRNVLEECRRNLNALNSGLFIFRVYDDDGKFLEATKNILKALIKALD